MKRSRIGLVVVGSLILNMVFMLQPVGVEEVAAVWPGYPSQLVFNSNRDGDQEIYTSKIDGQGLLQLTNNSASDTSAEFSPDGQKIVFVSNRSGPSEIYIMDSDGGNQQAITSNGVEAEHPSWSPDGLKIIFYAAIGGNNDIYSIDLNGSNQTRLTTESSQERYPAYSPDGTKIVYRSRQGVNTHLVVMEANGSSKVTLYSVSNAYLEAPQWSPDGQAIYFHSNSSGSYDIYRFQLSNSEVTQLTDDGFLNERPFPSADGKSIYFSSDKIGSLRQIFVMNTDGSDQARVIASSYNDARPKVFSRPNVPPVLGSKLLSVSSSSSQLVDVLVGATDEELLPGSNLTIITLPSHGSAIIESGKIRYTAGDTYVGADSLEYRACDSFMLDQKCSIKTLGITVTPRLSVSKIGGAETDGSSRVVSATNKPTFSGYTTPLAEVKVEIHSDPIILTTTADSEGYWSVTPTSPIPPGNHTVYISSTLNGQTTQLDSFVLGISSTIPNTGADYDWWRYGGVGLTIAGLGSLYVIRRRRKFVSQIPQLFP